jgi:hydroxymethylpyrimidine pyrophosphatase-like HAD family hydrolase
MNQEIKNEAIAVFTQYPLAKVVFITPDAQAFLKEDRARIHNKDFVTVKRSEVIEEVIEEKDGKGDKAPKEAKKSAEELIAFAATAETIEELDAILAAGEKRATVVAAFTARKLELTPNQE